MSTTCNMTCNTTQYLQDPSSSALVIPLLLKALSTLKSQACVLLKKKALRFKTGPLYQGITLQAQITFCSMLVIKADLAKMLNIHQNQKEPRGLSVKVVTTHQVSFQLSFQNTAPTALMLFRRGDTSLSIVN